MRDEDDMHFSMEPVDDVPTDDNVFSHRALCAARYHRNKFFMLDIMSDSVVTNHMPRIHTQDQLNQLFLHRQSLIVKIDKFEKELEKSDEHHAERKRKWEESSEDLNKEWKRLAEMSPEEYFAEYKAKQEAAKKAREEEERKRKEAEEKQKAEQAAQNDKQEDETKSEKCTKDLDENSQDVTLETMENKQPEIKPEAKSENPIDAMHQMVTMAGSASPKCQPSQQPPQRQITPPEMSEGMPEPPAESMDTETTMTPNDTAMEHSAPPGDRETTEANTDAQAELVAPSE